MRKTVFLIAVFGVAVPALAQENDDLARIPGAVESAAPPPSTAQDRGKYSLANAVGWYGYRGTFAVSPGSDIPSRWNDRISADALVTWKLSETVRVTASDVLAVSFADGIGFPRQSVRNDLRELYATWEVAPETYLEAGRINVRYGVAFGYNPTDFYRARTSVAQSSSDPGALRNNRLGTVMVRGQHVFDGGSLELIYAPKLHSPVPMGGVAWPLDPKIDQTNGSDRASASFSFEFEEFSPQVLAFYDSGRLKFGFNASHPIGNSIIAYASWAGGEAPSSIIDAIAFGKRTRMLPSFVPVLPPVATGRGFKNDVSAGAYWNGEDKETISIEYNFHQAGFSRDQWQSWFATGADPMFASLMWYLRGYAADRQDPASRHQAFVRADWVEPFHILHADINAYVMTNLADGSCTGQLGASYDLSDYWSVAAFVSGTTGGKRSEWGSLRGSSSAILQIVRYL
jgi:hypothetical protein